MEQLIKIYIEPGSCCSTVKGEKFKNRLGDESEKVELKMNIIKLWKEFVQEFNTQESNVHGLERTTDIVKVVRSIQESTRNLNDLLDDMVDGLEIRENQVWDSWNNDFINESDASEIIGGYNSFIESHKKLTLEHSTDYFILYVIDEVYGGKEVHTMFYDDMEDIEEVKLIVRELNELSYGKVLLV